MLKKFKVIEEQDKILKIFGMNVIISASAGSGKTSVLIRKISDYIENHNIDISNVLALTYTKAAAGEMKERLIASLIKYIEGLDAKDEKIERLSRQIDKISTADISTFHSFYEKIIKKYFYILGIDPSFEILSKDDSFILKEQAFEKVINEFKEKDFEDYLKITDILGKKRKDDAIREKIFKIEEFLSSQFEKEKWLEETSLFMVKDKEATYKLLEENIKKEIDHALNQLNQLSENATEEEMKLINDYSSNFSELKILDFKNLYERIINKLKFPQMKGKTWQATSLKEKIQEIKTNFKNNVEENFGEWEIIENSFKSCEKNIQNLINIYKGYSFILRNKKREINKFDFSDLEDFCLEILNDENIKEEIKKQYQLIFIDEFQDTNPVQYEIIKKISRGNNIFIVGDPKQSIYAFRQTDVDIFNSVFKEFANSNSKALFLKKNFRSNSCILDFVNKIFERLMTKEFSGIDYKNDSMFEAESKNKCDNESVIITLIEKEKPVDKEEVKGIYNIYDDIPKTKENNLEIKLITHQISKVINENIYDDKLKINRKIEYKDITILMRNRSNLWNQLIKELQRINVPFLVNDKIDLLSSKDVKLIISLLSLCNNLYDDENLAPVLVSDFVGLSYDDLSKIRIDYREEKFYSICCEKYVNEKNDLISQKLKNFYQLIKDLKFEIDFKGISLALDKILYLNNIFVKILLKMDGERRSEFIKQFVYFISQTNFNFDLFGLLDFINNSDEICVASLKECTSDAVNITTIHGSKGLEYPVVFLCDMGRNLNMKFESSDLKISKNLGIAIKNYNEQERKIYPSIFETIVNNESARKDLAENLRLLYVAMTRAKNKLFISAEIDKSKKACQATNEMDLLNIKPQCFINYILSAFSEAELEILEEKQNNGILLEWINDLNFECDLLNKEKNIDLRINKVKNYLEDKYEYPYSNEINLAQKTSVTEIIIDSYGQENLTSEPEHFNINEYLKGDTTAEKGTLIHNILEQIDLTLIDEELEKNIKEFTDKNKIFDKDYLFNLIKNNVLEIKKLIPFKSKIYKEKTFLLNASLKDIFKEGSEEKILIQGKVDLICIGEKNIIIDYKYTSIKSDERLINRYKKQLLAYSFAVEKALSINIDNIYIFDILNSKAIKIKK